MLLFHDFIIPVYWAQVKHILLSSSGKNEKEVGIGNQNNSLITGKAGVENVAQTTESKRSLLVLCFELYFIYYLVLAKQLDRHWPLLARTDSFPEGL